MGKRMVKGWLLLFFTFFILFSFRAFSFSPEEIEVDAIYFWELAEEVHPNLYHTTAKVEVEAFFEELKERLYGEEKYTLLEAYELLAPLAALFRDGHTNLFFPEGEWSAYLSLKGSILPFSVYLHGERLFIKDPFDEERFAEGTELLSINGIKIETLLNKMLSVISYENKVYGAYLLSLNFHRYLWAFWGMEGPFTITYASPGEEEQTLLIPGVQVEDLPKREVRDPFQLEFLTDRTGLLDIQSVPRDRNEEYFAFLEDSFRKFKEKGIENLIIDMRMNGGGSTHQFTEVYQYISDTPYQSYSRIDVSYSNPYIKSFPWYQQFYYRIRNFINQDHIITIKPKLQTPLENDLRFHGQVYLLVGSGTFSAASDFAALCQDFGAAMIIGDTTGGLPTSYGDSFYINLPHTGLVGRSSYKYFVRPSGEI